MAKSKDLGPYRKVYVSMHSDARIRALGPEPPSARGLWWHLLAGEHTRLIPGVLHVSAAAFADSLGWPLESFVECFDECCRMGLVESYPEGRLMFLPGALKWNEPQNPNVVTSWRGQWRLLPECDGLLSIWNQLHKGLLGMSKAYADAFTKACPKPSPIHSPIHSRKQEAGSSKQDLPERESFTDFGRSARREPDPPLSLSAFGAVRGCSLSEAVAFALQAGELDPAFRLAKRLHSEMAAKGSAPVWAASRELLVRLVVWVDRLEERGDASVEDVATRMVEHSATSAWHSDRYQVNAAALWGRADNFNQQLGNLYGKSLEAQTEVQRGNAWKNSARPSGRVVTDEELDAALGVGGGGGSSNGG